MITASSNGPVRAPYRQVQALSSESFRVLDLSGPQSGCSWHFHPEHQLGFVLRGTGERVVGDCICPITPGEVVLLGANLPHVWHYQGRSGEDEPRAVVVHFSDDFLGSEFLLQAGDARHPVVAGPAPSSACRRTGPRASGPRPCSATCSSTTAFSGCSTC